ncbi:MAG: hypothetical protein L6Q38_11695, partial [Nitrospira sp.]|nr:hypothetical protein [Nitrospira sp.]
SKDLMRLTRRNADLQQNSVHYRGSPPLPVNEAGPSIHSPNESMAKLEQSVRMKPDEAGTRNNSVMNNVQDLFGANVESDKMQKWAERICNPFLKAMVCGGRERDRAIMMRELAARTGHPAKEWAEWSLSTARASQEQFRDDLIQWRCGTGPFGTILTQLRGCVFLAKEIQTWPQESQELICDLLQPSVAGEAGHAWHDPVIASTDKTYRRPPRDPIQRLFLERLPVQLNLDLGPEKPAWMQRYSKVSYRELERLTDISKSSLQEYLTKETFRGEPVARNFEGCTYVHRQWLAANRVRTAPSKRPKDRRSD